MQETKPCRTRDSPFEVMFGRKGNLPIDFNVHATYDADEKLQEFLQVTDVFLICLIAI